MIGVAILAIVVLLYKGFEYRQRWQIACLQKEKAEQERERMRGQWVNIHAAYQRTKVCNMSLMMTRIRKISYVPSMN